MVDLSGFSDREVRNIRRVARELDAELETVAAIACGILGEVTATELKKEYRWDAAFAN